MTHDPAANGTAPGGAGEEKMQVTTAVDPFVERIVAVLGEQPRHRRDAADLVRRARSAADERVIDEAIGRCEGADLRPRSVAFFAETMARTFARYGLALPDSGRIA